jgi:hypothetical protein
MAPVSSPNPTLLRRCLLGAALAVALAGCGQNAAAPPASDAPAGATGAAPAPGAVTSGGAVPGTGAEPAPVHLEVAPDAPATQPGKLAPGGSARYELPIAGGQNLDVNASASTGSVAVSVNGADGTVLQSSMGGFPTFSGPVPSSQDYTVTVVNASASPAEFSVTIGVGPPAAPTSVEAPTPTPLRVRFPADGTAASQSGSLGANGLAKYVLALEAGHRLEVATTGQPDPVSVSVYGADGTVLLSPMGSSPTFDGTVPSSQDYFVDVISAEKPTEFTVTFTAPVP